MLVSARPPISNSSSPLSKPLGTIPSAPITVGITVISKLHFFFSSLVRFKNLSLFTFSLNFTLWSVGTATFTLRLVFFLFSFLLIITRSGLLVGTRWSVCISKSQRILCVSSSKFVPVPFSSMVKFLALLSWITFSTQPSLVLYSFCASLLHSLIIWLMVSSLSPHNLHLLFFSCEISPVCRLKYSDCYFSSHFCFLVVVLFIFILSLLLLAAVNSLSLLFFMKSSRLRIDVSSLSLMLASPLLSSFLDTNNLSTIGFQQSFIGSLFKTKGVRG